MSWRTRPARAVGGWETRHPQPLRAGFAKTFPTSGWGGKRRGVGVSATANVAPGSDAGTVADGPLAKVRTLDGNKESFRKIEPNDVIAKIDGRPVATELDLYLAIQGAAAPEKLSVEVISAKDGTTYTGTVSAAKPKQ